MAMVVDHNSVHVRLRLRRPQSTDLPIWVPLGWHATWSQSYSKKRVFWIFMHARILSVAVFLLSYCSLGYQNTSWHTCAFSIQRVFRASAWTVCTRSTSRICLQVADQKTPHEVFFVPAQRPPLDRLSIVLYWVPSYRYRRPSPEWKQDFSASAR